MTQYVVLGSDGKQYVVEASSPAEAQSAMVSHHLSTAGGPNPFGTGYTGDGMSPVDRAVKSAIKNFGGPVVEGLARAGNAAGIIPDDYVSAVQQTRHEMDNQYAADRAATSAPGSWDIAGAIGTAVPQMALTRSLTGLLPAEAAAVINAPKTVLQTAGAGAAQGAVAGATSPVQDASDATSNGDYFKDAAWQTAKNALLGGGIAPVARGAVNLIGTGITHLPGYSAVKGWLADKGVIPAPTLTPGQATAADSQKLDAWLRTQAQDQGVDWKTVDPRFQTALTQEVQAAVEQTGELPGDALSKRLVAYKLGAPQPTTAQVTNDPVLYAQEQSSAAAPVKNRLAAQQQFPATKAAQIVSAQPSPADTPYEFGSVVADSTKATSDSFKAATKAAFDAAAASKNGYVMVSNTSDMAKNAIQELQNRGLWRDPGDAMGKNMLSDTDQRSLTNWANGTNGLSARDAIKNLWSFNDKYNSDPSNVAMRTVKRHMEGLVYGTDNAAAPAVTNGVADMLSVPPVGAQFGLRGDGFVMPQDAGDIQDLFTAGRNARKAQGDWERAAPMNEALSAPDWQKQVPPEQVFSKYVLRSPVDDFRSGWATMDEPSQDAMRKQFVQHVLAMPYDKAQDFIDSKFPPEKLAQMFPGNSLDNVRKLLSYQQMTSEAPDAALDLTDPGITGLASDAGAVGAGLAAHAVGIPPPLVSMGKGALGWVKSNWNARQSVGAPRLVSPLTPALPSTDSLGSAVAPYADPLAPLLSDVGLDTHSSNGQGQ